MFIFKESAPSASCGLTKTQSVYLRTISETVSVLSYSENYLVLLYEAVGRGRLHKPFVRLPFSVFLKSPHWSVVTGHYISSLRKSHPKLV